MFTEPGEYPYHCTIHCRLRDRHGRNDLRDRADRKLTRPQITRAREALAPAIVVAAAPPTGGLSPPRPPLSRPLRFVGGGGSTPVPGTGAGATIEVPADSGDDPGGRRRGRPGDLILVSPGTYHEAVNVTTQELTIRGLDRNEVILDGEFELENGIRVLGAGGVAIENMTARNYTVNGFFWTGVDGYRGRTSPPTATATTGSTPSTRCNGQFDTPTPPVAPTPASTSASATRATR